MSDDIELPDGPIKFVSANALDAAAAERDELQQRINKALEVAQDLEDHPDADAALDLVAEILEGRRS